MVMIETFLGMAKYLSSRGDDDWADRLHYLITPNLLLAFAVLISWKQFGGHPIECMFPSKFPGSWEQYAEHYCWSQDTYFVEPDKHVELITDTKRYTAERALSYYQWVPFLLILQAAFFRAPSFIWQYFSNHSGLRIHEVVAKAEDSSNLEEEVRTKNIQILTEHLTNALRFKRRLMKKRVVVHKTCTCLNYQYSAGFMTTIYIFTKLVYLLNVVVQFYFINVFLKTDRYQWHGFGVIYDMLNGVQWEQSGMFPRAVVCDFEVRQVANIQKYSVQCVLVVNIFNEKIAFFCWFWYLIILVGMIFSLINWFILMTLPCFSRWFISQHLELSNYEAFNPNSQRSKKDVRKFVHNYLHRDGIFVLRMVSSHAGVLFATDLVEALWKEYYRIENNTLPPSTSPKLSTASGLKGSNGDLRKRTKQSLLDILESGSYEGHLLPKKDSDAESSGSSSSSSKDSEHPTDKANKVDDD
ncbi:hypothetical protein WR25_23286 isoform A [Diploscapter pachys]|uniref:Innexin n=2 Tax=Diploscapter pachys TaxID=2018661 RepID=A0A2A2J800_9BILA|nr:hypothetical protein WR25_23286 isoform A [Diploscapter pachys]